jgi:hypothetical protein
MAIEDCLELLISKLNATSEQTLAFAEQTFSIVE